jgi:hypothetical protein
MVTSGLLSSICLHERSKSPHCLEEGKNDPFTTLGITGYLYEVETGRIVQVGDNQ